MPEVVVRHPRGAWGRVFWRLFLVSMLLPILLMALIWLFFTLELDPPNPRAREMREILEALLYTLCFWGGLLAALITGALALLTRGRRFVIDVPPPPA